MLKETIRLEIFSNPRMACLLRKIIIHLSEETGFDEKDANRIALAVDEAFTNIIRHSYQMDFGKKICISISFQENSHLEIELQDDGPRLQKEKIQSRNLEEIRPGGLGVHFIYSVMDYVEYFSDKEKGNILQMRKLLLKKPITEDPEEKNLPSFR